MLLFKESFIYKYLLHSNNKFGVLKMTRKNTPKIFFILLAMLLLFSLSTYALKEDFYAYASSPEVSACACDITAETVIVKNMGDIPSTYTLSQEGNGASYAQLSETVFELNPGETKKVQRFISMPCSARGSYDLSTLIKTQFDKAKRIDQKIAAGNCPNVQLTAKQSAFESCPATQLVYEFTLTNTGQHSELFRLNVSKYNKYTQFSENTVLLDSGKSQKMFLYLNLPAEVYGDVQFNLQALADQTQFLGEIPLQAKINKCYDYDVIAENISVCNQEKGTFLIGVNNTADIANSYNIEFDSPKFAKLQNSTLFAWQKGEGKTFLDVNALNVAAGTYNSTLKVQSLRGDVVKVATLPITVENCNSFDMQAGTMSLVSCESNSQDITLKNTGTKDRTIIINVSGNDFFKLSKSSATIKAGESEKIQLTADVPCNATGRAQATVTANIGYTVSKEFKQKYVITPVEQAHLVDIKLDKLTIGGESSAKASIKNVGTEKGTYQLSIEGPEWAKLSETQLTLNPGDEKQVEIKFTPSNETYEKTYQLSFAAKLSTAGISYVKDSAVRYQVKPWTTKLIEYFLNYWYVLAAIIALIIIVVLLVLIIKALKHRKKDKVKLEKVTVLKPEPIRLHIVKQQEGGFWKWIALLLLLVIVAGGLYAAAPYIKSKVGAAPEETGTTLSINRTGLPGSGNTIIVEQDGIIEIPLTIHNLENYTTSFTLVADQGWIKLSKSKVTLNPDEKETVTISVNVSKELNDGDYFVNIILKEEKNNKIYSEVLDLKLERYKSWTEGYLPYVLAGFAALIILVLLIKIFGLIGRNKKVETSKSSYKVETVKEKKKRTWPWVLAVLVILAVIVAAVFFAMKVQPQPAAENVTQVSEEAPIIETQGFNFGNAENESIKLEISQGQKIVLPVEFKNGFDDIAIYKISNNNVSWFKYGKSIIKLDVGQSESMNITIAPTEEVTDGYYEMNIRGDINGMDTTFTKTLGVYVQKKGPLVKAGEFVGKYSVFFGLGIIVLLILIIVLEISRKGRKRSAIVSEIKKEFSAEKPKKSRKISFKVR